MDFAAFKAQLEGARRFEATADGATFRLRMPAQHAWRVAVDSNRDDGYRVIQSKAFRAVLNAAVVGWDGVKTTHLLTGADEAPLEFSAEAVAALLDERQDIADELTVVLVERMKAREEQREAARKN